MCRPLGWIGLICLGAWIPLVAQNPAVSVNRIDLKMVETGPYPPFATLTITTSGAWAAKISDTDVVRATSAAGTGNATLTVVPVSWRRPGNYQAEITISNSTGETKIPVTLEVIARTAPKFTYISEPSNCTDAAGAGFPEGNAAVCTVPDDKPPGTFEPPEVGGTYVDPNFGGRVRVIAGPRAHHGYSSPSPISAGNQYALVAIEDKATVIDLFSGRKVQDVSIPYEGTTWDAINANQLYSYSGSRILRYDIGTRKTETVADYSGRFATITPRGTAEMSKDNWMAFHAIQEQQICTLDLNTSTTYCGAIPAGVTVDYPTMAKGVDRTTGLRYVLGATVGAPFLVYAVNLEQKRLDLVNRGPENVLMERGDHDGLCEAGEACVNGSHSDTLEDSQGNQFLVVGLEGQTPCEFSLYSLRLSKGEQMGLPEEVGGGLKRLMQLFRCGGQDHWVDFHTGCSKQAPDCVISITSAAFNQTRDPNDTSPLKRTPYMGEILVIHDNGAEIRRLVEHRSVQFSNEEAKGYWSTPRAAISSDGGYVIASSNFGNPNQQRVILIETGLSSPALAEMNAAVNAASFAPPIAPDLLAIVFGVRLTTCTESATFPLPLELCGVKIAVAEQPARIFSVTPGQIAFLVPGNIPTNQDLELEVTPASLNGQPMMALKTIIPAHQVQAHAPALFTTYIPGSPQANVLLFDAEWNPRALRIGEIGITFAVGLGSTDPATVPGNPSPLSEPLARTASPPDLYINDVHQTLLYAGLVPGMTGVYQLVFRIDPATSLRDDYNWIWMNSGGVESPRLLCSLLPSI